MSDQRPDDHSRPGVTRDMPCFHCGHPAHPIEACDRCPCEHNH